jgi:lysophospholipase L1-like esterase
MQKQTDAMGSELVIVSIPDYQRVDPDQQLKDQLPVNIEIEDPLTELSAELGIRYINLLPYLHDLQAGSDEALYYSTDRHLTPAGNQAVADALVDRLLR